MNTRKVERRIETISWARERSIFSDSDAGERVFECITLANAAYVLSLLPPAILQYIVGVVERAPVSDAEWANTFWVGAVTNIHPEDSPSTEVELEAERLALQQEFREKVEAVREALGS
ncbi:MAG: hypothetical protein AAF394_03765 [Planctomycetota bacterium]